MVLYSRPLLGFKLYFAWLFLDFKMKLYCYEMQIVAEFTLYIFPLEIASPGILKPIELFKRVTSTRLGNFSRIFVARMQTGLIFM